ncbi:CLAVATA3/ESR (CLE)-related protein 10-like [Phalaenopsis equestris]|uniref:CLAVATA3/ESR (CLE)-related protein 10-like n=1 Tax=Phalaenopsis equestris TaxID=78828 RepID=UPI0009E3E4DF|nr:CLAVATA3/ESR (CLE)-related protein 10-like [Phalaenopsis equestris]
MRPHVITLFLLLLLLVLPIPGRSHVRQLSNYHVRSKRSLVAGYEPDPTLAHDDTCNDIDLRYGVEKGLVPGGPDPIHH